VAVLGLGGYAQTHHETIDALEQEGRCTLVATCDPNPDAFAASMAGRRLAERGVAVFSDYRSLLAAVGDRLDLVTVPTPVPFHAEMHRACVERGIACYLEKPPTLWWPELQRMQAVEAGAKTATQVGFNFIVEEPRQALKRRLLAGEFGALERVSFLGLWRRTSVYFGRAAWAGRLTLPDGRPVLDSCVGNAMAHYVHNLLFWAGTGDLLSWAQIASVRAELYRVHPIQSFDTVFLEAECERGVALRIAASHACREHEHREEVHCERATITYIPGASARVAWHDGRVESIAVPGGTLLRENLERYFDYLDGNEPCPLTCLRDCEPFVQLLDLALVASGRIATLDPGHWQAFRASDGGEGRALDSVAEAAQSYLATGGHPAPWRMEGGRADGAALDDLSACLARLVAESPIA
jgi:predicted dehydrogenase